jgi:hypothetical protein
VQHAKTAPHLLTTREGWQRDEAGPLGLDGQCATDVVHAHTLCKNAAPHTSPDHFATSHPDPKTTNAPHR